jgi:hypothetical protein
MSKKIEERQRIIRAYKDETGETDIDTHDVALWAARKGYPLPRPADPLDMLARLFADALRIEVRIDPVTKRPYRANHALPIPGPGGVQKHLWIDIDDPTTTRLKMLKCINTRREQTIGDCYQMVLDAGRWSRTRPNEEPIQVPLDFGPDVEWRMNSENKKAS